MKKETNPIQKDYSFLQTMSTEELQELLRRDMDLNQDESDIDLVLKALEVLESREEDSESENEEEDALNQLRETIKHREAMFADAASTEKSDSLRSKSDHKKNLWLRVVSIAAVFVLVITIGFSAAHAMGYDLWDGMVRWTKETISMIKSPDSFDNSSTFVELKVALENNSITIPILPKWLPDQYSCEDVQVYSVPKETRITSLASADSESLLIQVIKYSEDNSSIQYYETNSESAQEYETNGIKHYIIRNNDRILITWARENVQVLLEFSDSRVDTKKIIDSIYKG